MSEFGGDYYLSTDGSDSDDSAGSPAESVRSYVRSRPPGSGRVTFAPSDAAHSAQHRNGTDRAQEREEVFIRTSPRRSPRHSARSRGEYRISEDDRIRDREILDEIVPPRFNRHRSAVYGPDYLEIYPDEHNASPPRVNSRDPDTYYSSGPDLRASVSDLSESEVSVRIRHRSPPTNPQSRSRGWDIPRVRLLEKNDYDWDLSDDERFKVHHVINVHPSRSVDNQEMMKKWLSSRVFTHQSTFNEDEKTLPETYHIVQSRLVPRSEDEPHDRAILTFEEKAASSKTEIRWVHLQSNYLNLELFEMEALRQQNIPEATSTLIRSAFRYLRQRNEKSYVHGRYLDPTALSFVARGDYDLQESASVSFLAFPYFTLEPLRVQDPSSTEPIHPVRSLLQFHYSFQSTGQRDKDQVVCKVREVPDVLHVPQTWMLLVNEDLIVSMGPHDLAHIGGEYVSLEKAKAGSATPQIRLIDFEEKQYFLPKRSCQTWVEFISMISSLEKGNPILTPFVNGSWKNQYELRRGDELISEETWSDAVFQDENDVTIHIMGKPPPPLSHRLRRSSAYGRADFAHQRSPHYVPSASYASTGHTLRRSSMYSPSNPTLNDILVPHPTSVNNRYGDDGDSIRQHQTDVVRRHAWHSDKKPILLKDPDGFELRIPWRVGRDWQKMESVIGTKMQQKPEYLDAYNNDEYLLNGPDGPIIYWDWENKVFPGCTVELKLIGSETTGQMSRYRSLHREARPFRRNRSSSSTAVQSSSLTPAPPERIDTSRQIEYPAYPSEAAFARDALFQAYGTRNQSASVEDAGVEPNTTTRARQPGPSSQSPLVMWRSSSPNSDASIHTATGEQLGGSPRLSRTSTGPQSFVEDFDEDSVENVTEEAFSLDLTDPLPSVERISTASRDSFSTTPSDGSSSGSTESIKRDSPSQLVSPEEQAVDAQPDTNAEKKTMRPIFAWKIAASDGLSSALMGTTEPTLGYNDEDKTVRAILEEREAEATLYLLKHKREKEVFDSLPECSRGKVLVEMKVAGNPLHDSSAIQRSTRKRSAQKKLTVITNAIEILDAFVPVQYQNFHECWLIKKFHGALLAMTSNFFSDAYLDKISDRIASFLKSIRQIHARISRGGDEQTHSFYLPKALVDAFNPMIIYVCICSQISHEFSPEWSLLQRRARRIHKCLQTAEYQLISMIHAGDFSEAKIFRRVNAQDIVTMVTGRLARIPNGDPNEIPSQDGFNLLQIYRQYISGLELEARTSPNAEIFDEIQRLKEELNIVDNVLNQQLDVLERLRTVWNSLSHFSSPTSLQSIRQSRRLITQMRPDLHELEDMANKTSMLLRSMIEVRKESNSKAITIFTIVTVIFLPLSFVTSYLGMNSVDIREGTFKQSLFWIVALPSAAGLILTLWIVLKFRQRLRRWWPRWRLQGSLRKVAFWFYGAVTTVPGGSASGRATRGTTIM